MAAGGFREFLAGETLDEDAINDFLMQGMLVFAGTAARGSAITSPVEGQFSFRTDDDVVEFYDGSQWVELSSGPGEIDYFIVGGGGSGGRVRGNESKGGGGGGGGGIAQGTAFVPVGTYTVEVGAGASGAYSSSQRPTGTNGASSLFGFLVGVGGGGAGGADGSVTNIAQGSPGGSGGGAGRGSGNGGIGVPSQGNAGGNGLGTSDGSGAGGGGATASGGNATSTSTPGAGGAGLSSSITGSSVTYSRGGDGGINNSTGAPNGTNGGTNTGAGGYGQRDGTPGSGGSGLVVLTIPDSYSVSVGGGLTYTSSVVGSSTKYIFTAGSDDIVLS